MTHEARAFTRCIAACAALLAMGSVDAARNSGQRVRAFAALPDWTGFWEWDGNEFLDGAGGEPSQEELLKTLANTKLAGHPPYNAAWEARYQAALKALAAMRASGKADSAAAKGCTFGFPAQMEAYEDTFQLMVTPEETAILLERLEQRHIYTDGRRHPSKQDLWPTREGDSIGHWEGETLVVDTIARRAGPIGFFAPVTELSAEAHFIERIRMVSRDRLEDQMTIEDPVAFVHPWTFTIHYDRVRGLDRFIDYVCENDRNPIVNGRLTIAPP